MTAGTFIVIMAFILGLWVWPIYKARQIAKRKNRNYVGWLVFACFTGWVSVLILLTLTKKRQPVEY